MDTVDIENMTPLLYCVKFGHQSIIELLLEGGVPIDAGVHRKTWDYHTTKTAATCRRIISEHLYDVCYTSAGLTPLHFAALTGNPVMTRFLLNRGANPNAVSEHKETPLHLTLRKSLYGSSYRDDWNNPSCRAERLWDLLDFEEDDVEAVSADIDKNRRGVLNALLADPRTSLTWSRPRRRTRRCGSGRRRRRRGRTAARSRATAPGSWRWPSRQTGNIFKQIEVTLLYLLLPRHRPHPRYHSRLVSL